MPPARGSTPGPYPENEPLLVDIRPWEPGDLPLMQRIMGDPLMTGHLGGPESPEKLAQRHQRYLHLVAPGRDRMYVIVLGPERLAAGSVGYWEKHWQGREVWESGWHVLPAYQGRGIATRATAIVIDLARRTRLHRFLHAFPSVANAASNAICRKLGFALQGETDFEFPPGNWLRCSDWRLDLQSNCSPSVSP